MTTVYFVKYAKRRNSTAQADLMGATQMSCALKSPTSLTRPTFLISYNSFFDFNVAFWEGRYYFVTDVVSVADGRWEVSLTVDTLATYKIQILSSNQFISYADVSGDPWLQDTRIPVSREPIIQTSTPTYDKSTLPFDSTGFFCLSVTGVNGTKSYALTLAQVSTLISNLNSWMNTTIGDITSGSRMGVTYDFTSVETALESLSKIMTQGDVLGNAYSNAPANIHSCTWLPLKKLYFTGAASRVYLGNFDTGIDAEEVNVTPTVREYQIDIPWITSGWERVANASLSVHLPFVGVVSVPTDDIAKLTSIYVNVSINAIDGKILYSILTSSGGACIATYAGSCATSYAIGINQQSSLGEILQTGMAGIEKALSSAIDSSVSPISATASTVGMIYQGAVATYNVASTMYSTRPSTIGNMSGSVWSGLNLDFYCVLVSFRLSDYGALNATKECLGKPVMRVDSLNNFSGYVQCTNAHVDLVAAFSDEIDAIDLLLNTGIFIE